MNGQGLQGIACLAAALVLGLLAGCRTVPIDADEVPGIGRVVSRYRSEADTHRVGETFLGNEPSADGGDVLLLTDPASPIGYYFWILIERDIPEGSKLRLEIVETENQAPVRREFKLGKPPTGLFGEFVVGLTGASARSPRWNPIAWRVSLIGPDEKVLAARHSFLWGAPKDLGK